MLPRTILKRLHGQFKPYMTVLRLKKFPQIGHKHRDESEGEIRILLYGHYRVAYLIHHNEAVDILGVFHTALDIDRYL